MGLGQTIVLVFEAACVAVNNTSSNIAAVFFIFLYETCFTWGARSDLLRAIRIMSYIAIEQVGWLLCGCILLRSLP